MPRDDRKIVRIAEIMPKELAKNPLRRIRKEIS